MQVGRHIAARKAHRMGQPQLALNSIPGDCRKMGRNFLAIMAWLTCGYRTKQ